MGGELRPRLRKAENSRPERSTQLSRGQIRLVYSQPWRSPHEKAGWKPKDEKKNGRTSTIRSIPSPASERIATQRPDMSENAKCAHTKRGGSYRLIVQVASKRYSSNHRALKKSQKGSGNNWRGDCTGVKKAGGRERSRNEAGSGTKKGKVAR